MEEIFLLKSDTRLITDKFHLENYIKYLFSDSNSHQENIYTKNNSFIVSQKNSDLRYNIFPYDNMLEIFENISENDLDSKYYCDLNYVFFIIKINGKVITNMFDYVNKNIFTNKQSEKYKIEFNITDDILNSIINFYFNNNKESLMNYISNKISGNVEVINYNLCNDQKLRDYVEKKIHFKILEKDFENNDKLMVSISHLDQDDYQHVHRLFLETDVN